MRVVVDYDLCESNGVCEALAPDVFEVGEDDNLYLLQEEPPEDRRDDVEAAVARCPKQALRLEG
jgi:ferredoxin